MSPTPHGLRGKKRRRSKSLCRGERRSWTTLGVACRRNPCRWRTLRCFLGKPKLGRMARPYVLSASSFVNEEGAKPTCGTAFSIDLLPPPPSVRCYSRFLRLLEYFKMLSAATTFSSPQQSAPPCHTGPRRPAEAALRWLNGGAD